MVALPVCQPPGIWPSTVWKPISLNATSVLAASLPKTIPWERLSQAVWDVEIERFLKTKNLHVNLGVSLSKDKVEELKKEFDYVLIAVGTHQPRTLSFPGHERVIPALDYLKAAKSDSPMATGKQVVIIGAGNVGCDVAAEAYRLGADQVTLVDVRKPLAFGKERTAAEALGATFKWPFMTREVTAEGVVGADGTLLPAQTVIISIGDIPSLPLSCRILWMWSRSQAPPGSRPMRPDGPRILRFLRWVTLRSPVLATNALGAGKRSADYLIATFKEKIGCRSGSG